MESPSRNWKSPFTKTAILRQYGPFEHWHAFLIVALQMLDAMKLTEKVIQEVGYKIKIQPKLSPEADLQLLCIRNRNGLPRWVWPITLRKPLFLDCNTGSSALSKLHIALLRLIFWVGLPSLIFERLSAELLSITQTEPILPLAGCWALYMDISAHEAILVMEDAKGKRFLEFAISEQRAGNLDLKVAPFQLQKTIA